MEMEQPIPGMEQLIRRMEMGQPIHGNGTTNPENGNGATNPGNGNGNSQPNEPTITPDPVPVEPTPQEAL